MKKLLIFLLLVSSFRTWSLCEIYQSDGSPSSNLNDLHFQALAQLSKCPENVVEYKKILVKQGFTIKPSMVANRGRHNPTLGSFSFFEQVLGSTDGAQEGEFFFGHFTKLLNNEVVLDQEKNKGQLLIELIAWDTQKKFFNFYELIGQGGSAKWFYRGDSQDILKDNEMLYRGNKPQFGQNLRCSACHSSGGPIMKELVEPYNDWWTTARPLSFGQAKASSELKTWLDELEDASVLSEAVETGIVKLQKSPSYQKIKSGQTLQEQLRPLFCETEINIESSRSLSSDKAVVFDIFSPAFLNPLLGLARLTFSRSDYQHYLKKYKLKFPENGQSDADHVWLTPVKGYSDILAIMDLIQSRLIDEEFAYDVMAIDYKKNLFSDQRCQLLKLLPLDRNSDWKDQFLTNLKSSKLKSAQLLAVYLTDPAKDKEWHRTQSGLYLKNLMTMGITEADFIKLMKDRSAVLNSEISKNPRGQILEPGFRVIFPIPQ